VFQNLIGNALKFRAPGRAPSVVISAQVQGATATVAVADNGIGIEERHFDRIFGIFQRLHRQEEYEGEGVGLALCAKIIRRHGGRIWVESEVGKGSTFFFTLKTVAEGEGKDDGGRPKPADAAGSPG
jgi:light-regulated signal transduction histidine kinase (bacteriophytochrome)